MLQNTLPLVTQGVHGVYRPTGDLGPAGAHSSPLAAVSQPLPVARR